MRCGQPWQDDSGCQTARPAPALITPRLHAGRLPALIAMAAGVRSCGAAGPIPWLANATITGKGASVVADVAPTPGQPPLSL